MWQGSLCQSTVNASIGNLARNGLLSALSSPHLQFAGRAWPPTAEEQVAAGKRAGSQPGMPFFITPYTMVGARLGWPTEAKHLWHSTTFQPRWRSVGRPQSPKESWFLRAGVYMHHFKIKTIKCQLFWRKPKFTTSDRNDRKKPSKCWRKEWHEWNKLASYVCNKSQNVTLLIVIRVCKPHLPPRVPSARPADHWRMEGIHWKPSLMKSELVSERIQWKNFRTPNSGKELQRNCNKILQRLSK